MSNGAQKTVVAMSGGVDSSVAALILKEQGHDLMGVSLQVWDYRRNGGCASRATCCAPSDFQDARRVAQSLEIPYYVFDVEERFGREVIGKFVREYQQGRTPNPCVECNNHIKFRELRDRAAHAGAQAVATGHYARVAITPQGPRLLRGRDRAKDQSYFLYGIRPAELAATIFPIGELTKQEVRARAREAGFPTADKPESQDICFVQGSVADFVTRIGGRASPAGDIVSTDGLVLGQHDGITQFTVGQRRGLGVGGASEPLYVVEIDRAQARVVVGPKSALERSRFFVDSLSIVSPSLAGQTEFLGRCQVRHRHAAVPVQVRILDTHRAEVSFRAESAVVAPGQSAVFYDEQDEELLGGGEILGSDI